MTYYEELVVAATLGTARRAQGALPPGGPLGALAAALDPADAEGALLGASAAAAQHARAGRAPHPEPGAEAIAACPADERPECGPAAAQHLALMLQGRSRPALEEWLAAADALGLRAPARLLPDLLSLGRAQEDLRGAILPALGQRGRWLASLNPAWSYAAAAGDAPPDPALWETGARPARLAVLAALRRTDPAQARALVAASWSAEKADDRAAFLAALADGLSMDDEPFLEGALDDRSKEVRAVAGDLLSRLPASRLAGRARERLRPLLAWHPGDQGSILGIRIGRRARIELALPESCDRAMARDGVDPKPRPGAIGERGWWLAQLLAMVAPAEWSRAWAAEPDALVAAAAQHEHADALLAGWWAAAVRSPDAAWAEALLSHAAGRPLPQIGAGGAAELLGQLPPARAERLLLARLSQGAEGLALVAAYTQPWSADLARGVVAALQLGIRSKALTVWRDGHLLHTLGRRAPPWLRDEVERGWPEGAAQWQQWQGYVAQCCELLEFRRDMLNALQGSRP